jgi:hypothetical protein
MNVEIGTEVFAVRARGVQLNSVYFTYVCKIPSWLLVKQIADVKCAHYQGAFTVFIMKI